jgi:hypothetical protein
MTDEQKSKFDVATMKLETIADWLLSLQEGKFTQEDLVISRVSCGYLYALAGELTASNPNRVLYNSSGVVKS